MKDNYTLRLATLEEAYEIWSVMDICYQALEQKEYFICDDLDYVKDILSGHGLGVVACDERGKIVGNLLVKYPGLSEEKKFPFGPTRRLCNSTRWTRGFATTGKRIRLLRQTEIP